MRYLLFFVVLLVSAKAEAQKLVKKKLADNITMQVPDDFYPMSDEDKTQRYASARLPIALYTDPDRMAEFGVNRSYSLWQKDDLKMMSDFYEASIRELYDKVNFITKEIKTINEHDYVVFEFESSVYPENNYQGNISKYTYLLYALEGGTTYLFNFSCELRLRNKWQPVAHKMMESVKLK